MHYKLEDCYPFQPNGQEPDMRTDQMMNKSLELQQNIGNIGKSHSTVTGKDHKDFFL